MEKVRTSSPRKCLHGLGRGARGKLVPAALGGLLGGCGADPGALEADDRTGSQAQEVAQERANVVTYAHRIYDDPERARVSFAAPSWGGCSAAMLGPNLVMTAAHCGPAEADPQQSRPLMFMTYRGTETARNTETFSCARIIHGWPRHDLALLYCPPNAAGVSPGDKYGYLDLENRAPAVGDPVYSIWWNPVLGGATGSLAVPLYSPGRVTSTTRTLWGNILGGPATEPVGIAMDTWAMPGASGSANIDANTHRILVGPTTLASATEGPSRSALSMRTYLTRAELLAPGTYPGAGYLANITAANFPPLGFDFTSYVGAVDKTANGLFDVQDDLERRRGENLRRFYWFGFDSPRRNALWDVTGGTVSTSARRLSIATTLPRVVAWHTRLNLRPNTTYRVAVLVRTVSAGTQRALSLALERGTTTVSVATLDTTAVGAEALRTGTLRTDAYGANLLLRALGPFTGSVADLSLSEDGATMSFELADEREAWRQSSGARALFLPAGLTANSPGAAPDFALRVRPVGGVAQTVTTRAAGFLQSRTQRLCFSVRSADGTAGYGAVRVTSGTSTPLSVAFPVSSGWTRPCYSGLRTPDSRTALSFQTVGATALLVDNVTVEADPAAASGTLAP